MADQLSFLDDRVPPKHRYFFGIYVDPAVASHVTEMSQDLRRRYRLTGQPLLTERLHITLHHLGDYGVERESIVAMAREAGAAVRAAPFTVEFDHVTSFGTKKPQPLVLRGDAGLAFLSAFQKALGAAMARAGLGKRVEKSFTPHVTLLYDNRRIDAEKIAPIRWTVREFALIHSLLGETKHTILGCWPLPAV